MEISSFLESHTLTSSEADRETGSDAILAHRLSVVSLEELQARGGDPYEAVRRINETIGPMWEGFTKGIHEAYLKKETETEGVVVDFALNESGQVVGYAFTRKQWQRLDAKNEVAYLSWLAVDQNKQYQGIGSLLLESTLAKVSSLGYKRLTLDARETSHPFYQQFAGKKYIKIELLEEGTFLDGGKRYQNSFPLKG